VKKEKIIPGEVLASTKCQLHHSMAPQISRPQPFVIISYLITVQISHLLTAGKREFAEVLADTSVSDVCAFSPPCVFP